MATKPAPSTLAMIRGAPRRSVPCASAPGTSTPTYLAAPVATAPLRVEREDDPLVHGPAGAGQPSSTSPTASRLFGESGSLDGFAPLSRSRRSTLLHRQEGSSRSRVRASPERPPGRPELAAAVPSCAPHRFNTRAGSFRWGCDWMLYAGSHGAAAATRMRSPDPAASSADHPPRNTRAGGCYRSRRATPSATARARGGVYASASQPLPLLIDRVPAASTSDVARRNR